MTAAIFAQPFQLVGCQSCRDKTQLPFEFAMAFQPIMDLEMDRPFACEALVRGVDGESAGTVLSWVDDSNRYRFDQACRVKAIELATMPGCRLSINFCPTRCTAQRPAYGPPWRPPWSSGFRTTASCSR